MSSDSDSSVTMDDSDSDVSLSTDTDSDDSNEDETEDERESLLPATFQERESKLDISEFGLTRLRKFFLGQPIGREEKQALTNKYYCTGDVFELFQPSKIGSSPLALLKYQGGNASRDATFAHGEINFGLRLLISLFEEQLSLKNLFAPERKSRGKTIKAGQFSKLDFPYKSGTFLFPNPKLAMDNVSNSAIRRFRVKFDDDDPELLNKMSRYALGYKDSYLELAAVVSSLLQYGELSQHAITLLKEGLDKSVTQVGDAARLVGNSSQTVKNLREREYLSRTDEGFRDFVQLRKSGLSQKDLRDERLASLDEKKLLKDARDYCKVKKALTAISRQKVVPKKKVKKPAPSAANPTPGPSGSGTKPKKPFKPNKRKKGSPKKDNPKKDKKEEED